MGPVSPKPPNRILQQISISYMSISYGLFRRYGALEFFQVRGKAGHQVHDVVTAAHHFAYPCNPWYPVSTLQVCTMLHPQFSRLRAFHVGVAQVEVMVLQLRPQHLFEERSTVKKQDDLHACGQNGLVQEIFPHP